MFTARGAGLLRRVQGKPEQNETPHLGEMFHRLRERGHPPTHRFAPGEYGEFLEQAPCDRGADRSDEYAGRIGPAASGVHVRELESEGCDSELGELGRHRSHEWMLDPCAGSMCENKECDGIVWPNEFGTDTVLP